jgi:hypothetical protein
MLHRDAEELDWYKPDWGCTVGCLILVLSASLVIAGCAWLITKLIRWIYS